MFVSIVLICTREKCLAHLNSIVLKLSGTRDDGNMAVFFRTSSPVVKNFRTNGNATVLSL